MIVAMQIGSPLAAEPTVEQLHEIRSILADNDVEALRAYLDRNPDLLDGDTQLAVLLRAIVLEAKHLPNYLTSDSQPGEALGAPESEGSDDGGVDPADPDDNGIY